MEEMKKQLNNVAERVDNLEVKVDNFEVKVDKRFKQVDARLDRHEVLLEAHSEKLLEHDDRFDRLENQIADFRRDMSTRFDKVMTLLQDGKQERIFMLEWIKRNDKTILRHDEEIGLIKEHVGIE